MKYGSTTMKINETKEMCRYATILLLYYISMSEICHISKLIITSFII